MLISYSHKFIFLHVPKSGGISIREALKSYTQEPEKYKINRPPMIKDNKPNPIYDVWKASFLHAKAKDVRRELTDKIYYDYYKFAFVRNPWDVQVSYYHFLKNMHYKPVEAISSFKQYIKWVVNTKKPYPKVAGKFQKDILTDDNGKIIVDFIGKYENLEKDFNHVCSILNIKGTLPHLNATIHRGYRSYYNDYTRDIVADHFKPDIELFGYTF